MLRDDGATAEAQLPGFEVQRSIEAQRAAGVVVIDDTGSRPAALERTARPARPLRDAKLVLLTHSTDIQWLEEAASHGVDAAVSEQLPAAALCTLVRHVSPRTSPRRRRAVDPQLRPMAAG